MNIYECLDYKEFINKYIQSLPGEGRGEYGRVAKAVRVSSTLISQIFKGSRELSLEQAFLISEYLNLNEEELDYFELLVLMARSGIKKQKDFYLTKIKKLQEKNKSFKKFIKPKDLKLKPEEELVYYTEWIHAAVRILSEIEGLQTVESLSNKLKIEVDIVKKSAEFLSKIGMAEYESGKIKGVKTNIHLDRSSPFILLRQQTWRLKALENLQRKNEEDYSFNALMTIEEDQLEKIQEILKESVGKIGEQVQEAEKPRKMLCLNIDMFEV